MTDRDHPLPGFASMLADNLSGRRVLDRVDPGLEPEPATLAQLAPMSRLLEGVRQLRANQHFAAEAVEHASTSIVTALVNEAAVHTERHVSSWTAAERALTSLADLVDALGADSRPTPYAAAE